LFAPVVLKKEFENENNKSDYTVFETLSQPNGSALRSKLKQYAEKNGMISIPDVSGTNIDVQIFDISKVNLKGTGFNYNPDLEDDKKPVLFVMDYAFGEQAYETIDELLKPYMESKSTMQFLNVASVSIMGKAGILEGGKGDLMIPTAHIFEGTADNYPF